MNVEKLRQDFPIFERKIKGQNIIYLDNACMTLRPTCVINKIKEYYEKYPACAGRSSHVLANEVTEKYNNSRRLLSKFISAKKPEEIVFTRNTTEGINLIKNSLNFERGDVVLTTDKEHNSNLIPWQILKEKEGISHKIVQSNENLTFNLENYEQKLKEGNVKLVSMVHTSNLDGVTNPAKEIVNLAHEYGALVLLDGAQSVPRLDINVKKLGVDFLAFSGHKMCGPSGTGVLYGKKELLEKLDPFLVGGDTVTQTSYETHEFLPAPEKFEAGLQNYSGMIALGETVNYLSKIGKNKIEKHETELNEFATEKLNEFDSVELIGPEDPKLRGGIVSFNIKGLDAHDVALMLSNLRNVCVRSGQHCVHSWFNANNLKGSVRASFYLYNNVEDIQIFIETLKRVLILK